VLCGELREDTLVSRDLIILEGDCATQIPVVPL
jgi:hypothetical protein